MSLKTAPFFSKYRMSLLRELVVTDFKLRYQGSWLGYLWSVMKPLAMFAVLYVVFSRFLKFGDAIPHYPVYLLTGIVLWNFFVEATMSGLQAIVGREELIRKVNLPKYIIVLSTSFSAFINLFINLVVVAVFIVLTGISVSWSVVFSLFFVLELFIFAIALSFFLSALYVRFRDISHIWEILIQMAFYATPILYPISLIPERFAGLVVLNPIAQMIQDIRYFAITTETTTAADLLPSWKLLIPYSLVALIVGASVLFFKKQSPDFAENL